MASKPNYVTVAINKYQLSIDMISYWFTMYNFAIVGTLVSVVLLKALIIYSGCQINNAFTHFIFLLLLYCQGYLLPKGHTYNCKPGISHCKLNNSSKCFQYLIICTCMQLTSYFDSNSGMAIVIFQRVSLFD